MKQLALGAALILAAACSKAPESTATQTNTPAPATTTAAAPATDTPATAGAGVQEHTIEVAGMFTPASVTLKAGQPAKLHFHRGTAATCGDEIVFPELNVRQKIAANETITIDVPAQEARTLKFSCGMNMMQGTVVVQ